jgi:hypothetical protein
MQERSKSMSTRDAVFSMTTLILIACFFGSCASSGASEAEPPLVRSRPGPVPGEAFLRAPDRTLLAEEVHLEIPLYLEGELFLAGNKVKRWEEDGKKMKAALGLARAQFAEGLSIRETERIVVSLPASANKITLRARGFVVMIDQGEKRVVRNATALEVNGDTVVFRGPYKDVKLK